MSRILFQATFITGGLMFMIIAVVMLLSGEQERSGMRMLLGLQFWQIVYLEHLKHLAESKR